MLFVKEDIPSKLFSEENFPAEPLFAEMNKRRKKYVLNSPYNPNRENKENHFESLSESLALYSSNYENSGIFGLKSLIKDAAWYKNLENPRSIDLILTNNPRNFQNSSVIESRQVYQISIE